MITYVVCDLFTSPAQTLVNTVNTVGVMGKGIAKDFKAIYPEMFARYQELCERDQFNIGQLWPYRTSNKLVLNFPTKKHWRSPSRVEYIDAGLQNFAANFHVYGVTSISFPLLGCGNGELNWESQVRPVMEQYLGELPIDVYIHLHNRQDPYTAEHRDLRQMKKWLRSEPESLAFNEVWADLIAAIAANPYCTAIGTGEHIRIRIGGDEDSIILELADETIPIPQDAFLDLWQQLRAAGFLGSDYLPCGLSEYAHLIIPLMTKLRYIHKVEMAEQSYPLSVGLRIVPVIDSPKQAELLLFPASAVTPE
jgi:O-acetyl-ADP-ribose deacetylase (regulator of RNase III)